MTTLSATKPKPSLTTPPAHDDGHVPPGFLSAPVPPPPVPVPFKDAFSNGNTLQPLLGWPSAPAPAAQTATPAPLSTPTAPFSLPSTDIPARGLSAARGAFDATSAWQDTDKLLSGTSKVLSPNMLRAASQVGAFGALAQVPAFVNNLSTGHTNEAVGNAGAAASSMLSGFVYNQKLSATVRATRDVASNSGLLKAAEKPAARVVAEEGAKVLAKGAGRFAPGLNVAIAAADVTAAVSTWRDPHSSPVAKFTSTMTAVGSVAAATNIPGVSQVGAGISALSSIAGAFFG